MRSSCLRSGTTYVDSKPVGAGTELREKRLCARYCGDELGAVSYAEFAVGAPEVRLDRLGTKKQLARGLSDGDAVRDNQCDAKLLRRDLLGSGGVTASDALAGGAQLGRRPLGPRPGAELLERVKCRTELSARFGATTGAPESLAVAQLGSGTRERPRRPVQLEGADKAGVEVVLAGQERAAALSDCRGTVKISLAGPGDRSHELFWGGTGGEDVRLDEVAYGWARKAPASGSLGPGRRCRLEVYERLLGIAVAEL
jgi:hypothetical protein